MIRNLIIALCCLFLNTYDVVAQHFYTEKINEETYNTIVLQVEQELTAYKNYLICNETYTEESIAFMLDTFRIEAINRERQAIEHCTNCIVQSLYQLANSYEQLVNKYFLACIQMMRNEEEKKILITAQKQWLAFRNAEIKLIETTKHEYYSHTGDIQPINATLKYATLIKDRVISLYNYAVKQ